MENSIKVLLMSLGGGIGSVLVMSFFMQQIEIIPYVISVFFISLFLWIVLSRVYKSSKYPYWKKDEEEEEEK